MGTYQCKNISCNSSFKLGWVLESGGDKIDKSLCEDCKAHIDEIRGFLSPSFSGLRREHYFCYTCGKIRRKGSSTNPETNSMYCLGPDSPAHKINAQNKSNKTHSSNQGKFVCDICGKSFRLGHLAKGAQKTIGNTIMGVAGTLTFLTGGLTAPVMLAIAMGGAVISGSAEIHSICSECR